MKMYSSAHCTIILVCFMFLINSVLTISHEMNLPSKRSAGFPTDLNMDDNRINTSGLRHLLQRRTCDGFPCMYSHLGTKAGRASLYKTLASFIDDCFTDPACDPGRRKRQDKSSNIKKLLETPIIDLVRMRMDQEQ
ncbi:hypothetical protein ACF0H5_016458 [Mactra antiquata]